MNKRKRYIAVLRGLVLVTVMLLYIAFLEATISWEKACPCAADGHGGTLPPIRFRLDSTERCQPNSNFPGFVVKDGFKDRSGLNWDVNGFFFYFDRDYYLELFSKEWGGHQGDIEGAWILTNQQLGIAVTALTAHSYLQVGTNPRPGQEGYVDFFLERGKHGVHYEAGVHWHGVAPFMADGEGESFTLSWFDSRPVYSGSDGVRALREKLLADLNVSGPPRRLRAEPIMHSLESDALYVGIIQAAAAGKEKMRIMAPLAKALFAKKEVAE